MNLSPDRRRPSFLDGLGRLGGATPELLASCPSHERWKFALLALLHLIIATTYAVVARSLASDALPFGWDIAGSLLVATICFIIALPMLVLAMHRLLRWKLGAQTAAHAELVSNLPGPGRTLDAMAFFVCWAVLAAALFVMLFWRMPMVNFNMLLLFSGVLPAAPLVLSSAWHSPVYETLLLDLQPIATVHVDLKASTNEAATSSAPTEDQLRLELRLTAAFEESPHSVEIGKKLIEVRRRIGKPADALPVYDALLADAPDNEQLLRGKAEVYRELGDEQRYRKMLDHAENILDASRFRQNVGRAYRINNISTTGLEFFGDATWCLQPKVNILLGRNGYGKTLLLRALVGVVQSDEKATAGMLGRAGGKSEPKISVKLERDGELVETVRSSLAMHGSVGKMPVLAIPDVRYVNKSEECFAPPRGVTDLRSDSALHFLLEQPYEGMISTFLYELCLDFFAARDERPPLFDLIEASVERLTRSRFRIHEIKRRDSARFEINVITEALADTPLPLQRASQGTLSIIAMVGLTYKYLQALHPKVPASAIPQAHGVVVIDEIDAHLHPSWQQEILALFRETFPNVQFIVTAHSPLVIAGAKEGEVAVLRKSAQNQFEVEVRKEHFIGASPEELYRRIFDIEAKDATYQRLELLHLQKDALQERARELGKRAAELSPAQKTELTELNSQLYYVERFEEVKKKRDDTQSLQEKNQELNTETARLRAQTEKLNKEVERLKESDPGTHIDHTETFFRQVAGSTAPDSALEEFAENLADVGRNKEAAAAWQALLTENPDNSTYMRRLIAENLKLQDYPQALSLARSALAKAPNDTELLGVVRRLEQHSPQVSNAAAP